MRRPAAVAPTSLFLGAALVATLLAVQGCQEVTVSEVDVVSIVVSPGTATLLPDEVTTLSATPRDAAGLPLPSRAVVWRSDDPEVATVDAAGRVQARAAGTSRIEAVSGGVLGTSLITVHPAPMILLSRSAVVLGGAGGQATVPEAIQVLNGGGGSLSGLRFEVEYEPGQPDGWLDVELQGGAAPTSLTIGALPRALAPGSYAAEVRVISPNATNSPQSIQVALQLQEASPVLRVVPEALGFSTSEGQGAPPSQHVAVTNAGGGELTNLGVTVIYPDASPSGWLTAELDRTTAPTDLRLRADPAGLSAGVFDATVQLTSPDAPGGGASVQVRLRLGDPPPHIQVVPGSVLAALEEGSASPQLFAVQVANSGAGGLGGLSVQLQSSHASVSDWLQATLRSTDAPTVLDLGVTAADRLPGTYGAQVLVASADAINSPVSVGVQLVVRPRPSVETSTVTAAPESIVADGRSPSEITVTLNDPRGDPIPAGGDSVEVFTTAGTLSGVSSLGNGRYRATLVSSRHAGTAMVTARLRGVEIEDAATVHFRAGAADAEESRVSVSPASIAADSTATVRVELRDTEGNPLATGGDPVFLATDLGTLEPGNGRTTGGRFEAAFTSSSAGTATVTAHLGEDAGAPAIGTVTVTVTGTVEEPAADPGTSTITSDRTRITRLGSATIRVQLRDASGAPLTSSGTPIFLTTSRGRLSPASGSTTDGVFTSRFTSLWTGRAVIRAYLGENAEGPLIGSVDVMVGLFGDDDSPEAAAEGPPHE